MSREPVHRLGCGQLRKFRNAAIGGGEVTLWVINGRANSQEARLLYLTKLPRRPFAVEAVTGHTRHPRPINDRMWFGKIVAS